LVVVKRPLIGDGSIRIQGKQVISGVNARRRRSQLENPSTCEFRIQEDVFINVTGIPVAVGTGDGAGARRNARPVEVSTAVVDVVVNYGRVAGNAVDPTAKAASTGSDILRYDAGIEYRIGSRGINGAAVGRRILGNGAV
jgi:hypothetical protein